MSWESQVNRPEHGLPRPCPDLSFKASLSDLVTSQHWTLRGGGAGSTGRTEVIAREEAAQPGTVRVRRGAGRMEVEGTCLQVGKDTCEINWRAVSNGGWSSRCGQSQLTSSCELGVTGRSGRCVASQSSLLGRVPGHGDLISKN